MKIMRVSLANGKALVIGIFAGLCSVKRRYSDERDSCK